jgi:hydroxymethylglutaryl-CoA lyase|tara:strand:- start:323 stop:1177 length:855 start_codon:yes stop_codon:yes gene_type:complete
LSKVVEIFEVGPRDGLQNEKTNINTADKIKLIDALSECGIKKIEVSSFVSSKWIPQLADAKYVFENITRNSSVKYTALTPNMKGLNAAKSANVDEVAVFAAASETFSKKNINCSIEESFERFYPLIFEALRQNIPVRGYISCITDCPYEGKIEPSAVLKVASKLLKLGCYQISLGDTIGLSNPSSLGRLYDSLLSEVSPLGLAGHFHDTNGKALENIGLSLDKGLRTFDSSVGGLGGCPYAPGSKGNVATEKVIGFVESKGYQTEVSTDKLREVSDFAKSLVSC